MKAKYLKVLEGLSEESLRILSELATKKGIEEKLKKNEKMLKAFL